jgi:hypothetical protein
METESNIIDINKEPIAKVPTFEIADPNTLLRGDKRRVIRVVPQEDYFECVDMVVYLAKNFKIAMDTLDFPPESPEAESAKSVLRGIKTWASKHARGLNTEKL